MGRSPQRHGRIRSALRSKALAVGVGAVVLSLAAAACSSSADNGPTGGTPVKGGAAVYALQPSSTPNYIFPYANSSYFTVPNIDYLQLMLYRPLYWFGQDGQPAVNYSLSLAKPPVFNGTKVTINLKHYMWSNGTKVTAQDVMFWLNMEKAQPTNYGAYTVFPADVENIKVVSPTRLTMTMKKAYSPTWFLYNDLSQITPMPAKWDRTAGGPSSCRTNIKDCTAVYNYLDSQAKDTSRYVSSPLWSVVDGPWKLSAFHADGHITFVPNRSYSGPVKPKLAKFQEVPFATDTAEYDALQSPSAAKINVGYLPAQDAPVKPSGQTVGANPMGSKGYTLSPLYNWGINYYTVNFQSTVSDHAAIIKRLYFRQALEYMMNQAAVISGPLRGYGALTVGPVAATPQTSFLSGTGKAGDPFPYNPGKAKSLLTSHGWKVVPGGVSTCVNPAKCGPGIKKGAGLTFNFPYASGVSWLTSEMAQLQSNAGAIGIKLNLQPRSLNQVAALAAGNCVVAKLSCKWDMANYGVGWSFTPDYLPTGDELFQSGAVANAGGFSSKTNDALIEKTLTSGESQAMYNWEDYLANQLPMMWQPNGAYSLTEVSNNLRGVIPQSPTLSINPENWYFVK
jgi:peptide/nickel transport system substrate-binding protein